MKSKRFHRILSLMLLAALTLTSFVSIQPRQAEAATDSSFSWDNATVYFVMTDRFYDGNPANNHSYGRPGTDAAGQRIGTFHGGDVKGLTQKLNEGYFADLGVNAIWLTAPYEQIHGFVGGGNSGDFAHYAYHGYYPLDYTMMDRNMGTVQEMREFVDTAHAQGIRVVLDVVMNHPGYATLKDMEQYDFGARTVSSSWSPGAGQTWHSYHDNIDYNNAGAWSGWWGNWIRAGIAGYAACGNDDRTLCLSGLPDFRTEATNNQGLAPLLQTKWSQESTGHEAWMLPSQVKYRQNLNIAPADYIAKWLSGWVEEFGIDGFRVDTAKHVDLFRWQQLKNEANAALQTWRRNNPTKPGADWTDDFWMTGEVWGHGVGKSEYFNHGFDSVINFGFQSANLNSLESVYSHYASSINTDPTFNVLSYISSHDTSLYNRSDLIQAGTALLLLPGGVQIFYGDETARPFGETGSDAQQGTRSDMNWSSVNGTVLSHWQKLGQFRNDHIAVGAGSHAKIADAPYTFSRTYHDGAVNDKVVVVLNASGTVDVQVGSVFADGTQVRDAYTGATAVVSGGKARFAAGAHGVVLIEQAGPPQQALPVVSADPAGGTFTADAIEVTLHASGADVARYTLDGSDPATGGTPFSDGTRVAIGGDMTAGQSKTLRLYASNPQGIASQAYTYTKQEPPAGLTVHFKKPASWGAPQVYFYETSPKVAEPAWATAPAMQHETGDWYRYTIAGAASARIIFKDANGNQTPGANQPGTLRTQEGWFDGQAWHHASPIDTVAPSAPS